jgi:hypothetical protein
LRCLGISSYFASSDQLAIYESCHPGRTRIF